MNAPKPNKKTFPPSWKKWRCLKAGEALRASDRVVLTWRIKKNGTTEEVLHSIQLGRRSEGSMVSAESACIEYPAGWYFRKVS